MEGEEMCMNQVTVYAFCCGILKTRTQYLFKDTRLNIPIDVPVPFFLIRHGDSWVAFDTGNNARVAKDPVGYWGEQVIKAYNPVMKDGDKFQVQIQKLGLTPEKLKGVILSHGHLDHAGALDTFEGTDIPIYIQNRELENIHAAVSSGEKTAYIPDDFKVMDTLNIVPIEGVFDLFGDGTMVTFPTPGHTPGHQSLIVRQSRRNTLVLAADALYTLENMTGAIPPGLAWDIPQSVQELYIFRAMTYLGAKLVPSHDPDYWKNKPLAPDAFTL
jgi:N-acyl homoserine lactone hydrolase